MFVRVLLRHLLEGGHVRREILLRQLAQRPHRRLRTALSKWATCRVNSDGDETTDNRDDVTMTHVRMSGRKVAPRTLRDP